MKRLGIVHLVGAGPGDAGLITVRGRELLGQADAVVIDRLANPALVPAGVEVFDVGKPRGQGPRRQEEINRLLVRLARKGLRVVRLKGGDPLIFARGAEEALYLRQNGIPFEIVPGPTAASALAYAGIPLTHRNWAPKLTMITGTLAAGMRAPEVSDLPREGTLVIYMGLSTLTETVRRLIHSGWDGSTPAAVVEWASSPRQRVVEGPLREIAQKTADAKIESPALVVIGQVVSLRPKLSWFERLPLFGRRVVVTRPEGQEEELSRTFEAAGARVLRMPAIEIRPAAWRWRSPRDYGWIVFTSRNGAQLYLQRLFHLGQDVRALGSAKVAVVGEGTAGALREFGIEPDVIADEFTTDRLASRLLGRVRRGDRVLYPCAETHNPELAARLRRRGTTVDEVIVYRNRPIRPRGVEGIVDSDIVTLTSAMIARSFLRALPRRVRPRIVSIGPVTARAVQESGRSSSAVARPHTIEGLAAAVTRVAKNAR
jgi:uroporphyrinogen III methyltransferase/synthase